MAGLAVMDIQTQCKAIGCSILAKFIKENNQNKTCPDLMLWHLDQFRKAKQGVSIFKTYIRTLIETLIKTLFCRPIEFSEVLGRVSQVMKYLR